jgi:hypothetical protein
MIRTRVILSATAALAMALPLAATAHADAASMSFFVTSAGPGDGANLGGLDGADAHCGKLAAAAGSAKTSWRAYFSTTEPKGEAGINARDRIGKGPWQNVNGVVIAASVAELHSETNNLTKETALTEKGETVKGRGDDPNEHDILTGSDPMGMYSTAPCFDPPLLQLAGDAAQRGDAPPLYVADHRSGVLGELIGLGHASRLGLHTGRRNRRVAQLHATFLCRRQCGFGAG